MINDYPPKPADYYMNIDEITSLCDSISGILNELDETKNCFLNAEEISSKGAMEVDVLSISDSIRMIGNSIVNSRKNFQTSIAAIKGEAMSLYNTLSQRYESYLQELARQKQREEENQNG